MSDIKISTGHPDAGRIYAQALKRVTAERDALQQRLTVQDQRVDELETRLDEAVKIINYIYDNYGLSEHVQSRIEEFMEPGEEDTAP